MKKIWLLMCAVGLFQFVGIQGAHAFFFGGDGPRYQAPACPPGGCPTAVAPVMQPQPPMPWQAPPPGKRISKCKPLPVAACMPPTCAPPVCGPVCKPVCRPPVRWY